MKLKQIIEKFEEKFPKTLAYSWDNVGLLIGDENREINNILCCLEITDDIVQYSIDNKIDVIFSHHPLIFSLIKTINSNNFNEKRILKLIENKISVYAAHTNLDIANGGLNDYVISALNLDAINIVQDKLDAIRYIQLTKKTELKDLLKIIKDKLDLPYIRYIDTGQKIQNIAIVTGSGQDFINENIDKVDLFITSDLKHHISLDAREQGLSLIDIEHFGSEKLSANLLKQELEKIVDKTVNIYIPNMKTVFEIFS